MHQVQTHPRRMRRFGRPVGIAAALVVALSLAACGSSSSSSSSSAASSGVGLRQFFGGRGRRRPEDRDEGVRDPQEPRQQLLHRGRQREVGGALAALGALKESGTETSGSAATSASQLPAIQAAIAKGANALIVSATDPTALCPTLKQAMARGITVVTYDSDAPTCRTLFVNQASTAAIGTSEVDLLAEDIHGPVRSGSSPPPLRRQPERLDRVHEAGAEEVSEDEARLDGLRQRRSDDRHPGDQRAAPALSAPGGDHLPDHGGHRRRRRGARHRAIPRQGCADRPGHAVVDEEVRQQRDREIVELWDPAKLGYLAAYAAVNLASKKITAASGQKFTAGKLGELTVGSGNSVLLGPPQVFAKANIAKFNF